MPVGTTVWSKRRIRAFWDKSGRALGNFLMATKDDNESVMPGWWERMALLHYAVLRTTNTARLVGGIPSSEASKAL